MSAIVASAISHLKELERNMKAQDSNFKYEDIENCDKIAELLQELEAEVKRLHEELETETIKTSVFRHKMTFFNFDFKREVEENVKAARDSNMAVILGLRDKLDKLTNSIVELNERDKKLSEEIKIMEPQKKSLAQSHDGIIEGLNKKMSDKTSAQIVLNETRDVLRETNQNTLDLEEDMIVLKEKLVKERAEAREEKQRIDEEKFNTNEMAKQQEETNQNTLREVEGVESKLKDTEKALKYAYKENQRLEHSIAEILLAIQESQTNLLRNQKELENADNETENLNLYEIKVENDYVEKKTSTIKRTEQSIQTSKVEAEHLKTLKNEQDAFKISLQQLRDKYNELQTFIKDISLEIQHSKTEISAKSQAIVEIESRNARIYKELSDAQDSHVQVMDSLQRELEESKDQLLYEREARIKKQKVRDDLLHEIEILQGNIFALATLKNNYLVDSKNTELALLEKEKECNLNIAQNKSQIESLSIELDKATKSYNDMKNDMETKVNKIEESMHYYETENEKNSNELKEITPGYEELCKHFEEMSKDYDKIIKLVSETKNKKSHLEGFISSIKKKTSDHEESRAKLSSSIDESRKEMLSQMKRQNQRTLSLENKILKTGVKVEQLKTENDRFIAAINEFENEFKYLDNLTYENAQDEQSLLMEYKKIQKQLLEGWKSDQEITKQFEKNDMDLIKKLNNVMNQTKNREIKLTNVKDKLEYELGKLDTHLNEMEKVAIRETDEDFETLERMMQQSIKTRTSGIKSAATTMDESNDEGFYLLPEEEKIIETINSSDADDDDLTDHPIGYYYTIEGKDGQIFGGTHNGSVKKSNKEDEDFVKLPYFFTQFI